MHTYYAHILAYLVFALCTWKLKEIIFPSDLWDTEGFISKFGLLLIREGAGRQFSEGGRTVRNRMILSTTPPLKFKPSWKHCFKGALCFWLLLANTDCAFEQGWGISFTSKRTTIGFRKFRGKYLFYSWGIKIHLVSLKILSALTL